MYKFLYSTKLALYIFFALAAASIVGSYTTRSNLVEIPADVSALGRFFKTYDIFHSWWFAVIVGLFMVNLILCTIHHFIPHLRIYFSKEVFNEKAVLNPWISKKIKAGSLKNTASSDLIEKKIAQIRLYLREKGFKIHTTPKGDVAEKGRYSRLLPFLFHFGILTTIIGALIGTIFGFVGTAKIHVGTETDKYFNWTDLKDDTFDFVIRVDDFLLEYIPIPIQIGVIEKATSKKIAKYDTMEKQFITIEDSPIRIFVEEAVLDTRFTEPKIYFGLYVGDKFIGYFYSDEINEKIPDFPYELVLVGAKPPRIPKTMKAKLQIKENDVIVAEGDLEVNHPMTYNNITFYETNFDRDAYGFLYVGLQITKDPGLKIVYFGFLMMFVGIVPIFFVSHKKIYVTNDGSSIFLTGEATKDKKSFREEFIIYADELDKI